MKSVPDAPSYARLRSLGLHSTTTMPHEHCHDEAHDHDHAGHSHTPPPDSAAAGEQFSLFGKIDRDHVVALNAVDGEQTGREVIK